MSQKRPRVLLAFNEDIRYNHVDPQDLTRLEAFADWDWFTCEGGGIYDTNTDPHAALDFSKTLPGHDALIVCLGAPTVTADMLDAGRADDLRTALAAVRGERQAEADMARLTRPRGVRPRAGSKA